MRRICALMFFTVSGFVLLAQQYGNEWIDYSRTHYKVKITGDGIYRIQYNTLAGQYQVYLLLILQTW